jgi:hypothetical protein
MAQFISVADTAKLVRTALKDAFPKIKFSVRSKSYSGGASITISWIDGPTAKDVEAVTDRFAGATFDGMIDLKSYHTSELNGEQVHFGADYVFTDRRFSADFLRRRAARVAEKYGVEQVEVKVNQHGGLELVGGWERWSAGTAVRDLVMQEAYKTRVS